MEHAFNVTVATRFDIDTALFLQHLKHWTFKNLANKRHIHDGLCWTYDTQEALCDIFPYWTRRQIQRVIKNCLKHGLIEKGNYNATPYDRTCWYALTPKSYWFYPELADEKYLKLLYSTIEPNGAMEFAEWCNHWPQTVPPIPDTIPDTNPIKTRAAPAELVDKSYFLTVKDILDDNPHAIEKPLIEEWLQIRKRKKVPVTATAWSRTNQVMTNLKSKGLNPQDCFERMVASGWQGMDVKYFEQDLNKNPSQETRAANELKIRERELKAQEAKRQEIEDAKKFKLIATGGTTRSPGRPEGLGQLMKEMGLA